MKDDDMPETDPYADDGEPSMPDPLNEDRMRGLKIFCIILIIVIVTFYASYASLLA